ncbi:MAG: InlB B-repeat-containing protein [Treponema sp.]|nr:InlB B-repeat-containing protein [Treponema sp.]
MKKFLFIFGVLSSIFMLSLFTGCEGLTLDQITGLINGETNPDDSGSEETTASGTIKGKVLYQDGISDCSGIEVFLDKLDSSNRSLAFLNSQNLARAASYYKTATTNSDGSYEFKDLPDGSYTVIAGSEDSEFRSVARGIEISANARAIEIDDLHLVAVGSLSGTLVVDGGRAGGSEIGAMDENGFIVSKTTVSNKGVFKITGIPVGKYTLVVLNKGKYEELSDVYNVTKNQDTDVKTITVYRDATYVLDLADAAESCKLDYKWDGDGYSIWVNEVNFDLYTAKRKVQYGDVIRLKGKIKSDIDIDAGLYIRFIDNSDKVDYYKLLTADKSIYDDVYAAIEGPVKKGVEYDIDIAMDVIADQEVSLAASFMCLYESNVYPKLTFTKTTGSNKTYYSEIFNASDTKYVSAWQSEGGITFSGSVLSNVKNKDDPTNSTVTVTITNMSDDGWVEMAQTYTKASDNEWGNWSLEYPLVTAGNTYSFRVKVSNGSWTQYQENIVVKANSGLGELIVENADEFKNELTENRVMVRKGTAKFTDNPNISILRQGVSYTLNRGDSDWVIGGTFWSDNSNMTYPLKEAVNINGWRDWKWIDAYMSGHDYSIATQTILKLAGYTYGDTVEFRMNDWFKESGGEWGGEKYQQLVVWGASIDNNGKDNYKRYTKDELESLTNEKDEKITVEDLPGKTHEVTSTDTAFGGAEYDWVSGNGVFPHSEYYDFGATIEEPLTIPVIKDKDGKVDSNYRFKGWSESFPISATSSWYDYEERKQKFSIYYINAEFEPVNPLYTVTYYNNTSDNDTSVYTTQTYSSGFFGYSLSLPEPPVREDYVFAGWYTDKKHEKLVFNYDEVTENTLLYAGWVKLSDPEATYKWDDYSVKCYWNGYYQIVDAKGNLFREGNFYLNDDSLSLSYNYRDYNYTIGENNTLELNDLFVYVSEYNEGTAFYTDGFKTNIHFNGGVDLTGFKYLNIEAYSPDCRENRIRFDCWTGTDPNERGGRFSIQYMPETSDIYQSVWGTSNKVWLDWDDVNKKDIEKPSTSNILNNICVFTNDTDQDDIEATVYIKKIWATNTELKPDYSKDKVVYVSPEKEGTLIKAKSDKDVADNTWISTDWNSRNSLSGYKYLNIEAYSPNCDGKEITINANSDHAEGEDAVCLASMHICNMSSVPRNYQADFGILGKGTETSELVGIYIPNDAGVEVYVKKITATNTLIRTTTTINLADYEDALLFETGFKWDDVENTASDEIEYYQADIDITSAFKDTTLPRALDSIQLNLDGISDIPIKNLWFYAMDNSETVGWYLGLSEWPWSVLKEASSTNFENCSAITYLRTDAIEKVVLKIGYQVEDNPDTPCAVLTLNGKASPAVYTYDGNTIKCAGNRQYIMFKDGASTQIGSWSKIDNNLMLDSTLYIINPDDNSLTLVSGL